MNVVDVVLDCIVFDLQPSGGISRFWLNLISSLAAMPAGPQLHILINAEPSSESAIKVVDMARSSPRLTLYPYHARSLERIRQPVIPDHLAERGVFHSSYYRIAPHMPNISTIHDFTHEDLVGGWRAFAQSWQKSRGIFKSCSVVCVSESTKRDFMRHYPTYEGGRVEVIHHGVENRFSPGNAAIQSKQNQMKYVLFVGRRDAYKNFWCVVAAVRRLKNLQLVIAGPPLSAGERARLDSELRGRYALRPHVDDADLVNLYRDAFALAYPSRYEGFGLPVLEAMACGCPVVAFRASSIPEVAGNGAILLDEVTPESLAAALQAIESEQSRAALVRRGLEQSGRFSWAHAAAHYAEVYAAALCSHCATLTDASAV
jgi:mannosyltransferase